MSLKIALRFWCYSLSQYQIHSPNYSSINQYLDVGHKQIFENYNFIVAQIRVAQKGRKKTFG